MAASECKLDLRQRESNRLSIRDYSGQASTVAHSSFARTGQHTTGYDTDSVICFLPSYLARQHPMSFSAVKRLNSLHRTNLSNIFLTRVLVAGTE
eukprot:6194122-Pleurochrysis_carterae.AAC.4